METIPMECLSPVAADARATLVRELTHLLSSGGLQTSTDDDLLATMVSLEDLARAIGAVQVGIAGEIDARSTGLRVTDSLARQRGCRGPVELIQQATRISASSARSRVRLGKVVRPGSSLSGQPLPPRFEHVAAGLASGNLSPASAVMITDMLTRARLAPPAAQLYAQQCLTEAGSGISLGTGNPVPVRPLHDDDMRVMCRTWEAYLDQDGTPPREEAIQAKRGVNLGPQDRGLVPISGLLAPEVAATLGRLFDAINSPKSQRREDSADQATGEKQITDAGSRSPAQQRHDAFASILNAAAKSADVPQLGGAPVTVMIHVTKENFDNGTGCGWLQSPDGSLAPAHQNAVRHGACSGAVQYLTQNRHGRIIELESPTRIYTANQRRGIFARDGGCVIPGCTTPVTWCETHHVDTWADGGATHTDKGVALCYYHHRSLGTSGWEVRMKDGVPQVKAPRWLDPSRQWRTAVHPHRVPTGSPPEMTQGCRGEIISAAPSESLCLLGL